MRSEKPSFPGRLLSAVEKGVKYILFSVLSLFLRSRTVRSVDPARVRRILVIRQHNQLGDMLCAIPLLRALRSSFPEAEISVLARPINSDILQGCPFLDEVLVYHKQRFWRSPFSALGFLHGIRKKKFDLAITPVTVALSVSSDVLAYLSRSRIRIGPNSLNGRRNVTGYMYNVRVNLDWRRRPLTHQTVRNLEIARCLELAEVSHELELGLTSNESALGKSFIAPHLKEHACVIGFHPGAAKARNRWDALRFAELANRCAEILGAFIVVTAGPDDDEPLQEMLLNMPNEHLVLRNEPIRTVAAVIRYCAVFVTNDTGIMHVAAGVGTPVLSLFGPTDPVQWAPDGDRHRFVLGRGCSMDGITVQKAWEVLTRMISDTEG